MVHHAVVGQSYALCSITLSYRLTCCGCGVEYTTVNQLDAGQELAWPAFPKGWELVGGKPFCPGHVVTLRAQVGVPA